MALPSHAQITSRQTTRVLIRDWFFATPLGKQVLNHEELVLEQLLPSYFGYHLLQISVQDRDLFATSVIRHKFTLGDQDSVSRTLVSDWQHLPFEDDTIDVILLHHALEFCSSPQNLLREISRVALPMGQVVVVGFNPFSWWGIWKAFVSFRRKAPWNGKFIFPARLMDWLNLLNFKIDRAHYCFYGLPRFSPKNLDYTQGLSRNTNLPFGGVYIIVASKQVAAMIPMRPVWLRNRALGQLSIVQSARPASGRGASAGGRLS